MNEGREREREREKERGREEGKESMESERDNFLEMVTV